MEEQHTGVTQKYSGDMKEDTKSTNMDQDSSADEDNQTEEDAQENKEPDTPVQTHDDRVDHLNSHRAGEESSDPKDKSIETDGDNARDMDSDLHPEDEEVPKEKETQKQRNTTKTIGPSCNEPTVPQVTGGLAGEDCTGEDQSHDSKDGQGDGEKVSLEEVPSAPKDTSTETADLHHEGENKQPDTTSSSTQGNREEDQVDSHRAEVKEESADFDDTNAEPDNKRCVDTATEDTDGPNAEEEEEAEEQMKEQITNAETIGPAPQITESEATGVRAGNWKYIIAVVIGVLLAIWAPYFLRTESPPQTNDVRQIDVFLRELEKVKSQFPSQRAELWNRSRIHLQRHLQAAQPTEPVSLILTAGLRAERTMQCLAQGLASAFSSALNASVLQIDGVSQSSQDSDKVKLDIDQKLQGAFEGDKPVAVIHRFEELPPGSTLIFYRYCDHEHAAYKKIFLIFTVLLGEEDEIPAKIRLSTVEEMVDDHLQKKFLSHSHPVSFDVMDLDKYGGLWSRISHLILPVAAEQKIQGCKET